MFTGIIEEIGTIRGIKRGNRSVVLEVQAKKVLEDLHVGDSIATNGVCLTVISFANGSFCADVMPETMSRSNLGELHVGDRVNLERALTLNGRLGGHIVSGHVDGLGKMPFGLRFLPRQSCCAISWIKVLSRLTGSA